MSLRIQTKSRIVPVSSGTGEMDSSVQNGLPSLRKARSTAAPSRRSRSAARSSSRPGCPSSPASKNSEPRPSTSGAEYPVMRSKAGLT